MIKRQLIPALLGVALLAGCSDSDVAEVNSWMDDVDKSVSMLFYTMESNVVFDLLLVAPGTWFGMPVSALGIMS